jgi:hypothetical protein
MIVLRDGRYQTDSFLEKGREYPGRFGALMGVQKKSEGALAA